MTLSLLVLVLAITGCDDGDDRDDLSRELTETVRIQEARIRELTDEVRGLRADRVRLSREIRRRSGGEPGTTVAIVPSVGTLSWRCNDARRFSFTFRPESASVFVISSIDGETQRRMVHPGRQFVTPFVAPDAHLEWTITYRHKPATISAGISADPDVKRGACFIRNATVERNEVPN